MLISSIDIGSNTILLLVVEFDPANYSIKTLRNEYRIPRISKNLKTNLIISDEKITEMWNVFEEYNDIITTLGVNITLAVATNAFRIAKNGQELIKKISSDFKWEAKILSGDEEARLSFIGSLPNNSENDNFIVIDIGGGSTEIIYGSKKNISFKRSFSVGVVSLSEKFISNYPPSNKELNIIELEVEKEFKILEKADFYYQDVIAVAGTPTTLSCMLQGVKYYDEKLINNSVISFSQIKNMIKTLSTMSTLQINNVFGEIVKGREDVLLPGSIRLLKILEILKHDHLLVSSRGLRYGVIVDYINSKVSTNKDLKIL